MQKQSLFAGEARRKLETSTSATSLFALAEARLLRMRITVAIARIRCVIYGTFIYDPQTNEVRATGGPDRHVRSKCQ